MIRRWWNRWLDRRYGLPDIHGFRDKDDAGWAEYRRRKV